MKKIIFFFSTIIIAVALTASSCESPVEDIETQAEREYIALTRTETQISDDINAFCFNLFQNVNRQNTNGDCFVSPFSLSLALSMTAIGADGITAQEMLHTLGFDGYSVEEMNSYFQKLTEGLKKVDTKTAFEAANSIWINPELKVHKSFIQQAEKYYASEIKMADFSKKQTADAVNHWCSEKTHGKITRIVDYPDSSIMMALINALYFNGNWSFKFKKTEQGDFTSIEGKKVSAALMKTQNRFPYAESPHFQMVEIPYGNGAFVMDILLPDSELNWNQVVDSLDSDEWKILSDNLFEQEVSLTLPKFKMEYDITLNEILIAMGMKEAFSGDADFSKMSPSSLCIDQVRQKTYVDVNEKGTEAAAVTIVTMKLTSAGPSSQKVIEFRADRPFIFIIRECSSQNILFIGQKLK